MSFPHYTSPSANTAYVALCYRNFMANRPGCSHIGLGVNCLNTAKCLRAANIYCNIFPIWTDVDLQTVLINNPDITHVVIEAAFIDAISLSKIILQYPNIQFTCRCHSQLAFLQVEAGAVKLFRDYLGLQDMSLNFNVSINSDRMGAFFEQAYNSPTILLPNLYYIDSVVTKAWSPPGKLIKIGSFGAIRLLKNHSTAAGAALMLARVNNKDLQFYMSVHREEHGKGVLQAIINLFNSVPNATLIQVPWASWSDFKKIIANMDLHMQSSFTESFNIVSADACVGGVPTVCGEAIDWVPSTWQINTDSALEVSEKGWALLNDSQAAARGLTTLKAFNQMSLNKWLSWLDGQNQTMPHHHLVGEKRL